MNSKAIAFSVLIIIGVAVAWYFIGDVALAGLLALFGLGGANLKKANQLKDEADEHVDMANHFINVVSDKQEKAAKFDREIELTKTEPVDYEKPRQEVVDDAKKDWS